MYQNFKTNVIKCMYMYSYLTTIHQNKIIIQVDKIIKHQ